MNDELITEMIFLDYIGYNREELREMTYKNQKRMKMIKNNAITAAKSGLITGGAISAGLLGADGYQNEKYNLTSNKTFNKFASGVLGSVTGFSVGGVIGATGNSIRVGVGTAISFIYDVVYDSAKNKLFERKLRKCYGDKEVTKFRLLNNEVNTATTAKEYRIAMSKLIKYIGIKRKSMISKGC